MGAGIALGLGDGEKFGLPTVYPLQIAVGLSATWLIIGLWFPWRWLKTRPGPPLPEGENYFLFSWKKVIQTIRQARRLSTLFRFLIAWFIFSDGFNTILSIAILFFQSDLGVDQTGLLGAAIVADFTQATGVWFWLLIQRKFNIETRKLLMIQAGIYSLVPLWGLLGFVEAAGVGMRRKEEIWALGLLHGLMLGGVQSGCRVLFSELVPRGMETRFFSLYAITENGAAWVGPLVVAGIGDATGNRRYAFIFVFLLLFVPIWIFRTVDVDVGKREVEEYLKAETEGKRAVEVDVRREVDGGKVEITCKEEGQVNEQKVKEG
ncbi:Autophagy protein 22 [Rhizophlyctis rosea]|uniref:Autophagy-related protein n=1 Tax=Rhizophlyctis rosea TaxID=64517 RepID=A0AAD5X3R8_9FUNG|nr:Autophagy protein 22 [Rhizophlyctis rosea]